MLWTTLFSEGIHQSGIREGEGKSPHIPGTTAGPYRGVTLPRPPYFFVCTCPEIPVQRCDHTGRRPPGVCKEAGGIIINRLGSSKRNGVRIGYGKTGGRPTPALPEK